MEFTPVAQQCPDDVDQAAGQGDQGLGVPFPLGAFAQVEGSGGTVGSFDGRQCSEVEHPAQAAVVALRSVQVAAHPAGITRHLIRGRALRLDVPIERLASGDSVAAKNRWLADWLGEKAAHRRVRYYEEPTVSFDE